MNWSENCFRQFPLRLFIQWRKNHPPNIKKEESKVISKEENNTFRVETDGFTCENIGICFPMVASMIYAKLVSVIRK